MEELDINADVIQDDPTRKAVERFVNTSGPVLCRYKVDSQVHYALGWPESRYHANRGLRIVPRKPEWIHRLDGFLYDSPAHLGERVALSVNTEAFSAVSLEDQDREEIPVAALYDESHQGEIVLVKKGGHIAAGWLTGADREAGTIKLCGSTDPKEESATVEVDDSWNAYVIR
jgi:hypothetical protein